MITNGTRIRFNYGDEYSEEYGLILSVIPRRYRAEDLVYRITLEGYGVKAGGFSGKVLATVDRFEIVGGRNMSGNTVRAKARPYGSR